MMRWLHAFAASVVVREGRVTDVAGHVVRAIDGKPATAFYREFLGNADITHLTEYPLAVTADDGQGAHSYYLRAPGRTDEAGGCIHFLGDVPDGARVHITATNRDQILAATRSAFQHALDDFPKDSGGAGKPAAMNGHDQGSGWRGNEMAKAAAREVVGGKGHLLKCDQRIEIGRHARA